MDKSSDEFENGCIPMYCGVCVVTERLWRSTYVLQPQDITFKRRQCCWCW